MELERMIDCMYATTGRRSLWRGPHNARVGGFSGVDGNALRDELES